MISEKSWGLLWRCTMGRMWWRRRTAASWSRLPGTKLCRRWAEWGRGREDIQKSCCGVDSKLGEFNESGWHIMTRGKQHFPPACCPPDEHGRLLQFCPVIRRFGDVSRFGSGQACARRVVGLLRKDRRVFQRGHLALQDSRMDRGVDRFPAGLRYHRRLLAMWLHQHGRRPLLSMASPSLVLPHPPTGPPFRDVLFICSTEIVYISPLFLASFSSFSSSRSKCFESAGKRLFRWRGSSSASSCFVESKSKCSITTEHCSQK